MYYLRRENKVNENKVLFIIFMTFTGTERPSISAITLTDMVKIYRYYFLKMHEMHNSEYWTC